MSKTLTIEEFRALPRTEREIQKAAVNLLREKGYRVIVTSDGKKTGKQLRGLPDVFVFLRWGSWVAIDFKSPTGQLTKEQQELVNLGAMYIGRDAEATLRYVNDRVGK